MSLVDGSGAIHYVVDNGDRGAKRIGLSIDGPCACAHSSVVFGSTVADVPEFDRMIFWFGFPIVMAYFGYFKTCLVLLCSKPTCSTIAEFHSASRFVVGSVYHR